MENPQGQKEIQETIRINTHKRRGKYQVITFNPFTRKKKPIRNRIPTEKCKLRDR